MGAIGQSGACIRDICSEVTAVREDALPIFQVDIGIF
jgi:hypothetical protein